MNKSKKLLFVIIMLIVLTVIGIAIIAISIAMSEDESAEGKDGKLTVVTSFYPMYIAALNITEGADINLNNLSEPQTGCLHDYQLTTEDVKLLSKADVFIINGGGMEEFLDDVVSNYPKLKVVDSSKGVDALEDNAHMWMSIPCYIKQVENIRDQLSKLDPANADKYNSNAQTYISKLNELKSMENEVNKGSNVVLFSEAYEYVAKDYEMEVKSVLDLDEEKNISAKEVAETVDVIKKDNVPLIIAEKQYGEKMADIVKGETGVNVVYLDTIIRGDYNKDSYINAMRSNIELLKGAFSWK